MTLVSRFVLGSCYLFCVSGAIQANEANNDSSSEEPSPLSTALGPKENQYILQECEGFANEDNVSLDKRADYIKTCIDELSAAVKNAMDEIQAKSGSLITNNAKSETTED